MQLTRIKNQAVKCSTSWVQNLPLGALTLNEKNNILKVNKNKFGS